MKDSEGINADLRLLAKTIDSIREAKLSNEEGTLQARHYIVVVASYLSQFYTGLERCLEKKCNLAEIQLPCKSDHYHREILTLAVDAQLIPPSCVDAIDDLRGFRHFVRHAYGAEYREDEVKEKATNLERIWPKLEASLSIPGKD